MPPWRLPTAHFCLTAPPDLCTVPRGTIPPTLGTTGLVSLSLSLSLFVTSHSYPSRHPHGRHISACDLNNFLHVTFLIVLLLLRWNEMTGQRGSCDNIITNNTMSPPPLPPPPPAATLSTHNNTHGLLIYLMTGCNSSHCIIASCRTMR